MPSKEKDPLPIPTTYPTWLIAFVAPDDAKDQLSMKHAQASPPAPYQPQLTSAEPSTHSLTPAPLYPHTVLTIADGPPTAAAAAAASPPSKPPSNPQHPTRYRTRTEQDQHDHQSIVKFVRRLFAECLGTFIFVFLVAGVALEFNLTATQVDGLRSFAALNQTGCGIASGFTLAFLIYAMGQISGAHFNPCVTWAFTLRGLFPVAWLVPYWAVQFVGSILAGAFLRAFYWHNAHYGTTAVNPHNQWVTGFAYEALLTFFFINVILAVATRGGNVGLHAALADGFALAVLVMIGLSYTGTSVNPWRALGPGIVNGERDQLWVYVAGPFLGSTLSVLCVWALNGPLKSEDYGSAQGEGEAEPSDGTPEDKQKDQDGAE